MNFSVTCISMIQVLKSRYRNTCEQFAKIGNSIEEYELFEEQYLELETGTLSHWAFFSLLSKRFSSQ